MKSCIECKKSYNRKKNESTKRWESRQYCSHYCSNHSRARIEKCTRHLVGRKPPRTAFKSEDMVGDKHPFWKGGKPDCPDCGKKLSTYKVKHCSGCAGLHFRKENHPNWKGGISRDVHSIRTPEYREWRTAVFERDAYSCRMADEKCKGQLQAHHILRWAEFPEYRFEINNGITLCQAHHPRARAEEKRLSSYFMELVTESKALTLK